jgi:hypothetical protein
MQVHRIAVNVLSPSEPVITPGNLYAAAGETNWASPEDFAEATVRVALADAAETTGQLLWDADVLHPEIDVAVDHRTESRHYVEAIRYRRQTRDAFEQRLYLPFLRVIQAWGDRARRIQNGSIHRYLTFSLVTLIIVLVVSR